MTTHGFELVREQPIPEIDVQAKLYRHVTTGARLLSLENDDENKSFTIAFATPPEDSSGVPHILEHSVLCGSSSYPVKEPFKELRKGSLNTFLNAFTAPDKTIYPVASQNQADFYNLVRVYLDAVFKPLLAPETLQQQGWHYEMAGPDSPLTFKGVVFNEMKGAYSSPDSVLARQSRRSLFPDNTYGLDSGGDPAEIPDLTYGQFKAFYTTHYHPSNAYIVFYGDDHSGERLRLVDEYLSQYRPIPAQPPVPLQAPIDRVRRFSYGYDAGENGQVNGADAKRGYVTVNWLLNEIVDVEATLALQILSHILVSTQASPLRKALIDSGLGEGLTQSGYDSSYRQAVFSVGLKGIAPEDADQVEQLVMDTLATLAEEGIDPDMVAASLNTVEFRLREANTGGFPRGLMYSLTALATWMHGGDPLDNLGFEESLDSIKAGLAANPRFFEDLIRGHLLDNRQRTVVVLRPDDQARRQAEAAERQRLAAARAAMNEQDLQAVLDTMQRLQYIQDTPDSPEAVATIPRLTLEDLDRQNKLIPLEESRAGQATVLYHDLFTNGIVYLDVGFDLRALPQAHLSYAGLLGRLLLGMGTERQDFVQLSQRIGRETGGIGTGSLARGTRSGGAATWLFLRGKATADQGRALLDILEDVLLMPRLDNPERLRQIVLQEKASLEAGLIPGGHGVVFDRLAGHLTAADRIGEQMGGIDYLFFLRDLTERIDRDWPAVLADLEAVRAGLVNRQAMICNVTLDADAYRDFQPALAGFIEGMPAAPVSRSQWQPPAAGRRWEGLTIPAQVNYVGLGADVYGSGYELEGSALVAVNFLNNTWMWDKVRVQGGAYGGFCLFDNLSGVLGFLSYRDPNLVGTLETYAGAAAFLRSTPLSQDDLEKAIIGTIGKMDAYMLPDAKGYASMVRRLTGDGDQIRQRLRDEVLATGEADLRAFAGVLDQVNRQGTVVVLGSEQAIAQANESLATKLALTRVM